MFHQDATLLDTLESRLQEEEVFERQRKDPHPRALGLLLHHAGLSCRCTSQVVSLLAEPVSHNPISAWYRRAGDLFREEPARYHEELVVDETSLHIEDPNEEDDEEDPGLEEVFLWAALNPDTGEVVHVAVTEGRGGVEALGFLQGSSRRAGTVPGSTWAGGCGIPGRCGTSGCPGARPRAGYGTMWRRGSAFSRSGWTCSGGGGPGTRPRGKWKRGSEGMPPCGIGTPRPPAKITGTAGHRGKKEDG